MISDANWLSINKVTRVRARKVKLKHVPIEHYDDCMVLHQRLIKRFLNNKLLVSFTTAFMYEMCTYVTKANDNLK